MAASRPVSPSLSLLLAASAALTGTAHADPPATQGVSYRFNVYDEDALSTRDSLGDPGRYRVESQQLAVALQSANGNRLRVDATHEVMSGSSPWYVLPGPDGEPIQVLSGATIHDTRSEVNIALVDDNGGNDSRTLSASYSREQDYRATALGAQRSLPLNPAVTLGFGASYSHDIIQPSDALAFGRIERGQKNTLSGFASLSWLLGRTAVMETGLQLNHQSGFLSDPYKLVSVNGNLVADSRPGQRDEISWLVRYRLAATPDAALHLDTRLAANSWGQRSLTVRMAWHQSLSHGWRVVPGVRYYTQQEANFYAPYFEVDQCRYCSSDYRLGGFGAWALSLSVRKRIGQTELVLGGERYRATTGYALEGADQSVPAATAYLRLFAGLDFHFD